MTYRCLLALLLAAGWGTAGAETPLLADDQDAADLGQRLELFVDAHRIDSLDHVRLKPPLDRRVPGPVQHRIDSLDHVRLKLHPPRRMETALEFDEPWEGPHAGYVTVFQDDDRFRMYYRGWPRTNEPELTCYAESSDGIRWTKPTLGLYEWDGSKQNNILWHEGFGSHNFTPFKDPRPGVPEDERYKALGRAPRGTRGLLAFASADGLHWRVLSETPVLTQGAFDSQNLAFWDSHRDQYVTYYRIFTTEEDNRVRAIAWATSDDFLDWSDPQPIDLGDTRREHFYTNATIPYFRAPHYFFAFPKRFVPGRQRLPDHPSSGISDTVFLSSRDGERFDRTFSEALIRPGRDRHNWGDRSTMVAWGILQTAPDEMSIYYSQGYRSDSHHLQRGVFRLDGIASAHAGSEEGEIVTKPLRFAGERLILNYSTSAAGGVRVEIQEPDGTPVPGFTRDDAQELYGDEIAEPYTWKDGSDVSSLAGRPVRLRFILKDADLYSYRFGDVD